ncbi:alkaline phosphatase family protein [Oceanobacillus senegalensis]|uniref:alkaline phosphatase family protein n=1 Tax=Oceanobacillus senegalensis TaxID=1936063 RepID=UPI000A30A985|nr:alkaline phosphatase family protein [Oceanobacillus senegalensis]
MKQNHSSQKPVILLNIDSLMPLALEIATQTGRAPALQFLMENGTYFSDMVTSFPTMSVTIDSTLLTGTYPDQHQIPGLHWFDTRTKQFINYGTGLRETFRIGWKNSIHNMLYRLNHEHMSKDVSTIYEDLAENGISSASINSFVYRGNKVQRLKTPKILSSLTHFENGEWLASVPSTFSLGAFSKLRASGMPTQIAAGNYKYTAKELRYLIRKKKLPGFTFCIFQDMDARIHFKGPTDIKLIKKIDQEIQKILNMYSSWEEALRHNVWMVIGDNGHGATGTSYRKNLIDLRKIFKKYRISRIHKKVTEKDQLALCVNQRMAYIYLLHTKTPFSKLVKQLRKDSRIDVIAWKEEQNIHVASGVKGGLLTFRPDGAYTDVYNQSWTVEGNLDILDLQLTKNQFLTYGDYPDALARIFGSLNSHEGRFIVANAKPGCEFKAQSTPFHLSGAAHGSLHRQESNVPLIIAGTNEKPEFSRLVDLKKFILPLVK